MKQGAVELAIEGETHPVKDALSVFALIALGALSKLLEAFTNDATLQFMANAATVLTFIGAVARTVYIVIEWRSRRKMIAINKRIREEEAEKVAEQDARRRRIEQNMEDILYAPTSDEIAEILERNAREK